MFRIRTYLTNACLACFDLTIIALCHVAVWQWELYETLGSSEPRSVLAPDRILALGFVLTLWITLAAYFRFYHSRRLDSPFADAAILLKVGLISWIVLEEFTRLLPQLTPTPLFLLRFEVLSTVTLLTARFALRLSVRELRRHGKNIKSLVLIATPEMGDRVAEKIEHRAHLGYRIVSRIACSGGNAEDSRCIDELQRALSSLEVEDVIVALPAHALYLTARLARECESHGVNIRIVPDLFPLIQSDTQVYDLDGIPLVNVRLYPTEYLRYAILKRVFDLVASLAALIVFSPVYALIAMLVKLSSPGPVFFVQERVGLNGKKFKMLKFRTMRDDFNPDSHWTIPDDPLVTPVGRWLRRSNLDEIPQFLNVLKGEMSIVGPRPERPFFLERFRELVPEYMARHYVKSGITGWAQVNGWRGDTSISQRIACDLYYIRNWAFELDLKICFLTVVRTFFHRNAY